MQHACCGPSACRFDYDLTAVAGLALVGALLAMQTVLGRFEAPPLMKNGVAYGDIAGGYPGLLMPTKN